MPQVRLSNNATGEADSLQRQILFDANFAAVMRKQVVAAKARVQLLEEQVRFAEAHRRKAECKLHKLHKLLHLNLNRPK